VCGASRICSSASSTVRLASNQTTSGAGTITSPASRRAKSKTLWSISSCARGITPSPSASSTSARSSSGDRIALPTTTSRMPNGRSKISAEA
jgi:hypothetical protein